MSGFGQAAFGTLNRVVFSGASMVVVSGGRAVFLMSRLVFATDPTGVPHSAFLITSHFGYCTPPTGAWSVIQASSNIRKWVARFLGLI
ncbi:hypothetical protein HOY82DRAFT_548988 [Tuber indicum]|nr:hypothetical protein HOY82DRAFT_548988 [Tuber indicum]